MQTQSQTENTFEALFAALPARTRSALQKRIMTWYLSHRRQLPWRATSDPYAIWVSEVMLQQTQTVKVLAYYENFLQRFPTIAALAQADRDEVLKAWEGLGYYSRARNLHRAAQELILTHEGKLPHAYEELLAITGIGPYTAAAVASIAFNLNHAVLDGNVERVLSRIFLITLPPKNGAAKKVFQQVADGFLLKGQARDWNQALMELGATVCAPQKPNCASCPAHRHCRGYNELEKPEQLPVRLPKAPRPHYHMAVGLIWKGAKLLIDQRNEDGLLGGLWEFPGGEMLERESPEAALCRNVRDALAVEIEVEEFFTHVEHGFTHFSVTLHVYHCRHRSGRPRAQGCQKWRWATLEELEQLAFPTAYRNIISAMRLLV